MILIDVIDSAFRRGGLQAIYELACDQDEDIRGIYPDSALSEVSALIEAEIQRALDDASVVNSEASNETLVYILSQFGGAFHLPLLRKLASQLNSEASLLDVVFAMKAIGGKLGCDSLNELVELPGASASVIEHAYLAIQEIKCDGQYDLMLGPSVPRRRETDIAREFVASTQAGQHTATAPEDLIAEMGELGTKNATRGILSLRRLESLENS